jgi:hypothetical protein
MDELARQLWANTAGRSAARGDPSTSYLRYGLRLDRLLN